MSRDYLNKGIHIQDRTVVIGDIPVADPTLVTHGVALPLASGIASVSPPYLLVVIDIDPGAVVAPETELEFWGYFTPPSAGAALLSNWQHISTVILSDVVGTKPTMAVFPLTGLNRYFVCPKALTAATVGLRIREIAISEAAAQSLVSSGIASSGGELSFASRVEAFHVSAGVAKAITTAVWTASTADIWFPSGNTNYLSVDFVLSDAVPDTVHFKILKRRSATDSQVFELLVIGSTVAGLVDTVSSDTSCGSKIKTPITLGGYSFMSIPIDPGFEYSIQFIKTGAGAVKALAWLNFS